MATVIRGDDNFDTADNATQTELDSGLSGKLDTTADVGKILQVKSTSLTTKTSVSGATDDTGTGVDVGLNVTLTPVSSSSQFFVTLNVGVASCGGNTWGAILSRDGTRIGNGTVASPHTGVWCKGIDHAGNTGGDTNHGVGTSASYLDTVSGTAGVARTYKCGLAGENGNVTLNAVESDYSGTAPTVRSRTTTTLTVMEIGA